LTTTLSHVLHSQPYVYSVATLETVMDCTVSYSKYY